MNSEPSRYVPTSSRPATGWASRSRRGTACSRPLRRSWSRRSFRIRLDVGDDRSQRPRGAPRAPSVSPAPALARRRGGPATPRPRSPSPRAAPRLLPSAPPITIPHPGLFLGGSPRELRFRELSEHFRTRRRSGVAALYLLYTLAPQTPSREGRANQRPTHFSSQPIRAHDSSAFSGIRAALQKSVLPQEGMEASAATFTEGKSLIGPYFKKSTNQSNTSGAYKISLVKCATCLPHFRCLVAYARQTASFQAKLSFRGRGTSHAFDVGAPL